MRYWLYLLIGFMLFITGCDGSKMNDRDFAHWCMEQGRATRYTHADTLSAEQWMRAKKWIDRHGTPEDRAQVTLFLGRAYAEDKEYDLAMQTYANALRFAQTHEQYNIAGYICTYMADLYRFEDLPNKIREKYTQAAALFTKAGNSLSQAYALKNLSVEYAFVDSFVIAKRLMQQVDSLARQLKVQRLDYNIANALANIYYLEQRYDSAIYYFKKGIELDTRHGMKDSVGLADSYLAAGQLAEAKALVDRMYPHDSTDFTLNELYVEIYEATKNYKQALRHKKISFGIYDSLVTEQNETNVLSVEKKYNHLKLQEENQRLKNARQRSLSYIIILFSFSFIGVLLFYFYKKEAKQRIRWQEEQMNRLDKERTQIAVQLEKAQQDLAALEKNNQEEKLRTQTKIAFLTEQYQHLQEQRLKSTPMYKKLVNLCSKKQPGNGKALLNDKLWSTLFMEINIVYPSFYTRLYEQCPNLTEDEHRYCYLHILGFDSNDEATLLGILPNSISMKRSRIKQKLATETQKNSKLSDILASYFQA